MTSDELKRLDEPVRFELARGELTGFLGEMQRELGLSDALTVSLLECVLGAQRASMCTYMAQRFVVESAKTEEDGKDAQ